MFGKKDKLPADRHDDEKYSNELKSCPNCSGTGKIGSKECIACGGYGKRVVQGG